MTCQKSAGCVRLRLANRVPGLDVNQRPRFPFLGPAKRGGYILLSSRTWKVGDLANDYHIDAAQAVGDGCILQ